MPVKKRKKAQQQTQIPILVFAVIIAAVIMFSLYCMKQRKYTLPVSTIFPTHIQSKDTPSLTKLSMKGQLEIDLKGTGTSQDTLKTAYLNQADPAMHTTLEQLIRRQVFSSFLQTVFHQPALPFPHDILTLQILPGSYDSARERVLVPYALDGYLVSPEKSLVAAVPELKKINGEKSYTFTVPADPRNLFQRLGFACANQIDIPLGQVDDKNYGNYFDPSCAPGVPVCEHPQGKPLEACLDILKRENGIGNLDVHLVRVPYDTALASAWTSTKFPVSKGGADITVDKEKLAEYDIIYKKFPADSCAIQEQCIGGPGMRRLLRFRASTPNIGDQNLTIGDPKPLVETSHQFAYNSCHEHYHFNGYGLFTLEKNGKAVLPGTKESFCVESTGRATNSGTTPFGSDYQLCTNQGITAGWEDEYFIGLDCQWIDITDLDIKGKEETYQLSFEVNHSKLLCEGEGDPTKLVPAYDEAGKPVLGPDGKPALKQACKVKPEFYKNNKVTVDVAIPRVGGAVTQDCGLTEFGNMRNCGWNLGAVKSCTPGTNVAVQRTSEVIRACTGKTPCPYDEALVSADGGEGSFTCPAEGSYHVMTGKYVAK